MECGSRGKATKPRPLRRGGAALPALDFVRAYRVNRLEPPDLIIVRVTLYDGTHDIRLAVLVLRQPNRRENVRVHVSTVRLSLVHDDRPLEDFAIVLENPIVILLSPWPVMFKRGTRHLHVAPGVVHDCHYIS